MLESAVFTNCFQPEVPQCESTVKRHNWSHDVPMSISETGPLLIDHMTPTQVAGCVFKGTSHCSSLVVHAADITWYQEHVGAVVYGDVTYDDLISR